MSFKDKIKELRRKQNLTQEQLAELLSVSPQAVSRWETGTAMPDISLLIPMANFFDVTIDDLLGRETERSAEMEVYKERVRELSNKGSIPQLINLSREMSQKYPNDFVCLSNLSHALIMQLYKGSGAEIDESNAKEAINICERILRDCTDDKTRSDALQHLVILYSHPTAWPAVADEEKAVSLANSATSFWTSKEFLLETAYSTEGSKEKQLAVKHNNIINLLDCITRNIYKGNYNDPKDKLSACESALTLWETIISDGNYLFYHCRIKDIYELIATCHAEMGDAEEAVRALTKAMHHAKQSDNLPCEVLKFTSPLVRYATSDMSRTSKNYSETNAELLRSQVKYNRVFDFIRDDPEFIELMN